MTLPRRTPPTYRFSKCSLHTLLAGVSLSAISLAAHAAGTPNFGPNVVIIQPGTSPANVSAALNAANGEGQFTTGRHAVFFLPGNYTTVNSSGATAPVQVGFYEQVAGLGTSPSQVNLTGGLASDQILNGNLTQNFWRSQENLYETPSGGLSNGILDWGVSQGASLRRLEVNGNLWLVNSGSVGSTNPCAEASGGFSADVVVTGQMNECSQQQWYTRNSTIGSWASNVWNFVFSGVTGAPTPSYPGGTNNDVNTTVLPTTPVSREKPFLYVDSSGNYNVFSPALRTNSSGTSWSAGGLGSGSSLPISSFFIAQPSNTVAQINAALASGQNLILTPGIYQYSQPITVTKANTVVLGMGYATLVPQAGNAAISVADVDGVQVAGLLIDAGPTNSPVLFEVGNPNGTNAAHASNPTSLNDVFFRVGGATNGLATTSLQVDSGNVILDNIWAWRADHGAAATGWTVNVGEHGLVVNGANVTALGLAVEHYEQQQVLWNGNGGETIFYQSELPYDVPNQNSWVDGSANGYPSYVVASTVCTHKAYGLGIYSFFTNNVVEDNAMTVPNVTGISVTATGSVWLGGAGSITHVINGVGAASNSSAQGTLHPVASYVGSGTCTSTTPPATSAVAINAGGPATSGYSADADVAGGNTYSNSNTPVVTQGVANAAPAAVYQDEHEGGSFTYTIPGFTAGSTHTVLLHFAELYFSQAGQRVFNVAINGKAVLTNFDIVATAGSNFKAVVESFSTTANSSGQIVISFTSGTANQPLISGIQVQ